MIRRLLLPLLACLIASSFTASSASAAKPIIDNDRVTVWDVTGVKGAPNPVPPHRQDFLTIYLAGTPGGAHKKGDVVLAHRGNSKLKPGERTVVIEFKDHPVAPLANKTGLPLAFPRPHVKKVLETDHFVTWSYAWTPGEPTPMHFHDKDVVVIYMEDTALRSTTPDGAVTNNEYKAFDIKFNLRDRSHTESLIRGTGSAIMTELK